MRLWAAVTCSMLLAGCGSGPSKVGSGGIGAVSYGISEIIVKVFVPVIVVIAVFVVWKLAKRR